MWKLYQFVSGLFSEKLYVRPLLVDKDVGMQVRKFSVIIKNHMLIYFERSFLTLVTSSYILNLILSAVSFLSPTFFAVQYWFLLSNTLKDPNDWTRYQLCHASKVLFLVPRNPSINSATPIQHQWHCALSYFSGTFLKQNQNISSRCASILIPGSMPLVEGNEVGTRQFM